MSHPENTSKFVSLHLEREWVEAAGHVDFQMSNPEYVDRVLIGIDGYFCRLMVLCTGRARIGRR